MISDCLFRIGSSHTVCEDYTKSVIEEDRAYAVLADGCSSSPDTDFGARILVSHSLSEIDRYMCCKLESENKINILYNTVLMFSKINARSLRLDRRSLDATLMMIYANNVTKQLISTYWGDGIFAIKRKSGTIEAWITSYDKGYPSYPSYMLEKTREENRIKINDSMLTKVLITNNKTTIEKPIKTNPLGVVILELDGEDPITAGAIFSDGATSFSREITKETSKRKISVDVIDMLPELMSFKGKGEFARRRINGLLRKNKNLSHYDDLSIGAILI